MDLRMMKGFSSFNRVYSWFMVATQPDAKYPDGWPHAVGQFIASSDIEVQEQLARLAGQTFPAAKGWKVVSAGCYDITENVLIMAKALIE